MDIRTIIHLWIVVSFLWSNLINAAPVGGVVVAGQASISQQGNVTQITQGSQNAIINWHGFDTAATEQVNFTQPNAQAIALNRINSGLPTQFSGLLTANGQVWIVNPAGVIFNKGSQVDTAGILVTTLDIQNSDFMNGVYHFTSVPNYSNTSVINNGEINTIQDNGLVALVAPGVENNGIIRANAGKVVLASGTDVTLDFYGDNLISFAAGSQVQQTPVDQNGNPMTNAVSNNGKIQANNNGQVLITANAAEKVVQNVVSMNGVVEAKNAFQTNSGVIILGGSAGVTHVGGTITSNHVKIKGHHAIVDGTINIPTGGTLETSGDYLELNNPTLNLGSGSNWIIDPYNITVVSGGQASCSNNNCTTSTTDFTPNGDNSIIGVDLITTQLNLGNSVSLNTSGAGTDAGDITINSAINATSGSGNLSFTANRDINVNQSINILGNLAMTAATTDSTGTINMNTSLIQTGGTQTYNGNMSISNVFLFGNSVTFNGNIDGSGSLQILATNNINFNGEIGSTTPLSSLIAQTTSSGGLITINTDAITTSGSQDYSGNTTLNSSTTTFTTTTSASVAFDKDLNAISNNTQTININTTRPVFEGSVGSASLPFNTLNISMPDQGNVELMYNIFPPPATQDIYATNQNYTTSGTGYLFVNSDLTTFHGNTTFTGTTLDANFSNQDIVITGNAVFNAEVGVSGQPNNLTVQGSTTVNTDLIKTAGTQTYTGPVTLSNSSVGLTGSSITFGNTVDGAIDLAITGNAEFDNIVGGTTSLNSLSVAGSTNINTSNINTTGTQTYTGPVTLSNSTTDLTGSLITFSNTLDGASDLTITGNAEFDNIVGGTTSLNGLSVSGSTNINTSNINTTGAQTYTGPVTLSNSTTALTGSLITFSNTLDGASDLTVTGNAEFDGNVGNAVNLNSITVSGTTNISSPNITTTGKQSYSGPVFLNNGVSTTNLTGSLMTFGSTLDGSNDFVVTGNAVFQGNIGMSSALHSLTVTGQTTFGPGVSNVRTFANQDFEGPVTLNSSMNFTGLDFGSQMIFGNIIQGGGFNFTVQGGSVFLSGNVGSIGAPLGNIDLSTVSSGQIDIGNGIQIFANSLNVHDAGFMLLGASDIHTANDQTYNTSVLLTNAPLNLEAANITFGGSVLDLVGVDLSPTVAGTVTFNGSVNLNSLTMNSPVNLANSITTTANQTYNAGVNLTGDVVLSAPNLTINNGITGNGNGLGIDAVNTTINGAIVNVNNFNLTGTGDGSTIQNSFTLNTGAQQTWNISGAGTGAITGIGSFNNIQSITGGSSGDIVNFSSFPTSQPVSIIMTNVLSGLGSGTSYNKLIGSQIDTSSPIIAFSSIGKVIGNSNGYFQGPAGKQVVVSSITQQISPTVVLGSGFVSDPLFFEDFFVVIPAASPSPDLSLLPNILNGNDVSALTSNNNSNCIGDQCTDIEILTDEEGTTGSAGYHGPAVGTVSCMLGFATALDADGIARILMPGDPIYTNEKITTDDSGPVNLLDKNGRVIRIVAPSQQYNVNNSDLASKSIQ